MKRGMEEVMLSMSESWECDVCAFLNNGAALLHSFQVQGRTLSEDEAAWLTMLALTQLSNYLTLKGSFSAVSKPTFTSNYAFESSRRDL